MRTQSDRIDKAEMLGMMKAHFEFVTLSADELNAFLDRAAFRAYELLDAEHQATAQTARTLLYTEDGDIAGDSILIREFGALLMRYVADITEEALAMSPVSGLVPQFSQGVAQLASVDAAMIEHAGRLTLEGLLIWNGGYGGMHHRQCFLSFQVHPGTHGIPCTEFAQGRVYQRIIAAHFNLADLAQDG